MNHTRVKPHPFILTAAGSLLALVFLLTFTGCSSAPLASLDPQVIQPGFKLTISSYNTQGKYTYFTLDPDGKLSFAGGRAAARRDAAPVTTLSDAQRHEIWSLVVTSGMLKTKSQLFKTPKEVAYDVEIDPGKSFGHKSFHVTDQSVPPAVIKLHDLLFSYQADVRYNAHLPAADTTSP